MTEALSAALFHFLWQGAILALVPTLALMFRSPRIRYAAACTALFAMPLVFAVTFALSVPQPGSHITRATELNQFATLAASGPRAWGRSFDFAQSMRWFVPFWLVGVALFYLRTLASWVSVQRLRRDSSAPAPAFWLNRVDALAERLGIRRAVALLASELVDVPVVAGFLRPVIFVPAALFTGMPAEHLEYLLIHELAHVRRFDYAVNLLRKAVEGLLFYHPAVWWVSRILQTERENCCDDAVVAMRGNARQYASILASLEQSRTSPALAATGGNLTKRVLRLLNRPQRFNAAPVLALVALAVTATFAWAALQQPGVSQPYRTWVAEDVAYIVTNAEREAFQKLGTDAECEQFIQQFWQRRDPTPGTPENEFKTEHYRRIAYANARFIDGSSLVGWKTDRGRIYITFGPPDEIDSHTAEIWELWRYKHLDGIGDNILIRFEGADYRMTSDPAAR